MLEKPSDLSQRIPAQSHNASSVHQDTKLFLEEKFDVQCEHFFFFYGGEFIFFQISTKMIVHTHTLEHGEYIRGRKYFLFSTRSKEDGK